MPEYSIATNPLALGGPNDTLFGIYVPEDVRYLPPPEGAKNLLGESTRKSTREGREFFWEFLPTGIWTSVYLICGGDDAGSAPGAVRCKDWGSSGSVDSWGDYECVLHMPREGRFWIDGRLGIVLRITRMVRKGYAPGSPP